MIIQCINEKFDGFLKSPVKNGSSVIDRYSFQYPHEFKTVSTDFKTRDEQNIDTPVYLEDQIANDWELTLPVIQEKYERRIQRFHETMRTNNVVFVIKSCINDDIIKELYALSNAIYANTNVYFIVINSHNTMLDYAISGYINDLWGDISSWETIVNQAINKFSLTYLPKHILQIALGEEYIQKIPLKLIKDNLLFLNPGYRYSLFTEEDCLNFLSSNFPEHLELYKAFTRPQYKSDLIRYLYIYMNGGYYVDIDLLPIIGFDELNKRMEYPSTFFTLGAHKYNNQHIECANGFYGSEGKNPIFLELVKEMYSDINPGDYGMNVKRMYSNLASKMSIEPFKKLNNIFFLEEYCNSDHKYFIRSSLDSDISSSNGNGYPYNLTSLKPL
jgi:hypothetical protein